MGVEPTYAAWEAAVLPMNYIRTFDVEVLYQTFFTFATRKMEEPACTLNFFHTVEQ